MVNQITRLRKKKKALKPVKKNMFFLYFLFEKKIHPHEFVLSVLKY